MTDHTSRWAAEARKASSSFTWEVTFSFPASPSAPLKNAPGRGTARASASMAALSAITSPTSMPGRKDDGIPPHSTRENADEKACCSSFVATLAGIALVGFSAIAQPSAAPCLERLPARRSAPIASFPARRNAAISSWSASRNPSKAGRHPRLSARRRAAHQAHCRRRRG